MNKATVSNTPQKPDGGKRWNVMIYMAADNSLSEECVFSLKEMQRVGTGANVDVIAQFHSSAIEESPRRKSSEAELQPFTRQYLIRKLNQTATQKGTRTRTPTGDIDGDLQLIARPVHQPPLYKTGSQATSRETRATAAQAAPGPLSASNPDVLKDFILTSIDKNKAQNACSMVILSGHGSGAVGEFLKSNNPPASLELHDLREVFQFVSHELKRKIDIVLMDSCLMSMAEVAHELSGAVRLLIGAEGFELSTGWPYHRVLETLNAAGKSDPKTLARMLVSKYVQYYSDYDVAGVSVDQAVCDLTHSPALKRAVRKLAVALRRGIRNKAVLNAVLLAHWRAQSYNADQYVDLWDFCNQLSQHSSDKNIREACNSVKAVIAGDKETPPLVLQSCYSGAAFQHSHGVSIYFPWATDTPEAKQFKDLQKYNELSFSTATTWGDFLEQYLDKSRGEIRNDGHHPVNESRCFIPTDETRIGLRTNDPLSKGGSGRAAKVKNPPVKFFREVCE
ncbi:MAG TPA: clostripain-related cysteine peptidase [Blastocatellia bacterium]|nr:clostripain-related cysteine peptidase [Blastocatellia bacterium]